MKKVLVFIMVLAVFSMSSFGAYVDDSTTLGLWHMDSVTIVADDDSANSGRNNDLYAYNGPTVVSAANGNGMLFDGVNDYVNCRSPEAVWSGIDGQNSLKIGATFRVDIKSGVHFVVDIDGWNCAALYTNSGAISFFYKLNNGSSNTLTVYGVPNSNPDPSLNPFITATAIVDPVLGLASLQITGVVTNPANGIATANISTGLAAGIKSVEIGGYNSYGGSPTNRFGGVIDEVKISYIPEPATLSIFGLGLLTLRLRKKEK